MIQEEVASYHALAIVAEGQYQKLKRDFETHGSWRAAALAHNIHDLSPAIRSLEDLEKKGIALILRTNSAFPEALLEIPSPPFALYVRGALLKRNELCVAIVGTRRATREGKKFAEKIAVSLSEKGLTVVSGLALGIDAAAQGAVAARSLRTIGVLANGLDTIYPRENINLGEQLLASDGSLVSEYPPGTPPLPHRFLERNRIVAGFSKGVVVIEAPESSGSLSTANFALEQNREVLVSPGFPEHPNYIGSHKLIKTGACLITSANDVLEALNIEGESSSIPTPAIPSNLDVNEKAIINVLMSSGAPMGVPDIVAETDLDPRDVGVALGTLVIAGVVSEQSSLFAVDSYIRK